MSKDKSTEHVVWVGTMYGAEANQGLVELSFGESTVQLRPEEAVSIGQQLIEAAEVARTETFLIRFIGKRKALGMREIAALLQSLRKFRDSEEKADTT